MKRKFLFLGALMALSSGIYATPVKVTMNAVSTTMTLADSEGKPVDVGLPANRVYEFDAQPGSYTLTAYGTNGTTVNGTINLDVVKPEGSVFDDGLDDEFKDGIDDVNQFTVITCTAYVTNKHDDGTVWTTEDGDYAFEVKVNTREGQKVCSEPVRSITAGRFTFLAFNGNSYQVAFIPGKARQDEGFMTLYRGGTLTANVNVSGAIPKGGLFSIVVPHDANLKVGMKFTHFTDFTYLEPDEKVATEGGTKFTYTLADGQVYNYRTWKKGALTHAGYFTMSNDPDKCPVIAFTDEDFAKKDPKAVNHSPQSNNGYETGDIFLNVNSDGHLALQPGEKFLVHAMRTWELSDNATNNYFIEPDFHYTVLDENFRPCSDVIEIGNADTNVSAWSEIYAKGPGTAIVLVGYDGINLNYYNKADKKDYLGGEYWGAVWPENIGVFVVTVGEGTSDAKPEMVINEQYNVGALRLAGKYVDAEHDVFYYLDSEEGFRFTFTPADVVSVEMATPVLSETGVGYTVFQTEGVSLNPDGSYTLLLKEGRNIVRLKDASGNAVYRVLRAKPCHREIENVTRPGSSIYQPGDRVKIQYSGLFHPANKIAGIYNMSAYVTYNGIPNGSSLILGAGQYIFGSAPSAQAVTIEIPEDYNASANPEWFMNEGVIQVNGYGDPIGNHRNTSPTAGRSPNFTAVPHKTYFGALPDIRINVIPMKLFDITLNCNVEDAEVVVYYGDKTLECDENGHYCWTYGTYDIVAKAPGYRCFRCSYEVKEGDADSRIFDVTMVRGSEEMWDGVSRREVEADIDGVYHVATGAELAFIADKVASEGKNFVSEVVLDNDVDLGDFDWSPIGVSSSKPFGGKFDGRGHTVKGLYINQPANNLMALFGYVTGTAASPSSISNLKVEGYVAGKQNVGGIVANLNANASIDRCANFADVSATSYAGGVVGYISSGTNTSISSSYNHGSIAGNTNVGGVAGYNNAGAIISNIYSIGEVKGGTSNSIGACVGSTTSKSNVSNAFAIAEYAVTEGHILVSMDDMQSGKVAYLLGDAFGQNISEDLWPVIGGDKVYKVVYTDNADTDTHELFTNASLPQLKHPEYDEMQWFDSEDCVCEVTFVEEDTTLYARFTAYPFMADAPVNVLPGSNPYLSEIDRFELAWDTQVGRYSEDLNLKLLFTPVEDGLEERELLVPALLGVDEDGTELVADLTDITEILGYGKYTFILPRRSVITDFKEINDTLRWIYHILPLNDEVEVTPEEDIYDTMESDTILIRWNALTAVHNSDSAPATLNDAPLLFGEDIFVDSEGSLSVKIRDWSDGTYIITVPESYLIFDGDRSMNAERVLVFTVDSSVTGAAIKSTEKGEYHVYGLNGLHILSTSNAGDIRSLAPGIYIVNGSKVLIRN